MSESQPRNLIIIGFILVLLGFVLPLLIVSKVLPSTMFLNFLSFIVSVTGLFLGIVGAATYARSHRK